MLSIIMCVVVVGETSVEILMDHHQQPRNHSLPRIWLWWKPSFIDVIHLFNIVEIVISCCCYINWRCRIYGPWVWNLKENRENNKDNVSVEIRRSWRKLLENIRNTKSSYGRKPKNTGKCSHITVTLLTVTLLKVLFVECLITNLSKNST